MKRRFLARIHVLPAPHNGRCGWLTAGGRVLPCAIGKGGMTRRKREGDGATPIGDFPLLALFFRPDRRPPRPHTGLPARAIRPHDGWCDDPGDPRYNQLICLPSRAGHERMWREDGLYDLVVDIGWNRMPRPLRGRGSAIFMHAARPGFPPTEGCVALALPALRRLLARIGPRTRLVIGRDVRRRRVPPALPARHRGLRGPGR
ncbi:L,D-transpeptidase family protein [Saliniramus fredricksonii]|uniref:L,D-peptidoglycan transpeptidase YkuD, ErfK/YbiS/YcfS/YnhG family n=1 Tax=Saliniramus fredricksonii TaxID=1653334 RepID=A0ABY0KAP4_9HYPH|nr:L,D-transpeptidase family protein [Saliniramus fredricksonii]SCC81554.1 L,D-peptidoglycan transpeptidase YkuD, ErfK/YbiS/YcfS/YnhG family [Saliniramus fredricksonii]